MKLAIGCDHAGFPLKDPLRDWLASTGHELIDCGTHSVEPVDFPDIAEAVCQAVLQGRADRGLLVCGTGVGASIAANKIPGMRAAVCHDTYSAHQCVEHDNVNLACIGAQIIGERLAREVLAVFLSARFSAEIHFRRRVEKLAQMETRYARQHIEHSKNHPAQ